MAGSHDLILIAGVLCLLATFAGLVSVRIGTPLLLVFIGVGVLAGEDGPGGIHFDDFQSAYLIGSLSLAVILFEGGLGTSYGMIKRALWASIALATVGVALSAGVVGLAVFWLFPVSWAQAFLLGAVTAPTDAAAVSVVLRLSRVVIPERVVAALEVESGLNDPMSVFLTVVLVGVLTAPGAPDLTHTGLLLLEEMGGGAVIGGLSGVALRELFRIVATEASVYPVVAFGAALAIFGGAQILGASGFLAVYLAGIIVGNHRHAATEPVQRFFATLGWLAQICLFLMLGLLVTPHELAPWIPAALTAAAVLILLARPIGVFASLTPFRWPLRERSFIAWVGLRGAVPIYLTIIPLLQGVENARILFDIVFVVVIVSVAVQGWTVGPVARLLGWQRAAPPLGG